MGVGSKHPKMLGIAILLTLLAVSLPPTNGHGRLMDPPSRASQWRKGFDNPKDWDDDGNYCGGAFEQEAQGGKCGICGDPWQGPKPHEVPGRYANGHIVASYNQGQTLKVSIDITANHLGYFQFKLCPNNNIHKDPKQDCFDSHLLLNENGGDKYWIHDHSRLGYFYPTIVLPSDVSCDQCILQWTYRAANNWGRCKNGTEGMGCGTQEHFRACADIEIKPKVELFNLP